MKFNIFSIFAGKAQRSIESLISTKDKIEEIRRQYNKKAAKYIKSAENMLVNARQLKTKFDELDTQTAAAKRAFETLVDASQSDKTKLDEAKIKFITYKGLKNARDTVENAWQNTEKQCVKVRDTLKNIDTNKALMDAKLMTLNVQIDSLNICDCSNLGDFGIDCNEMIAEVEKEVQNTQFRIEAKQEISQLVSPRKESLAATAIDQEFEDAVKEYQNR